jgi:alpha-beta hydrolase superfamily lysophospholipase
MHKKINYQIRNKNLDKPYAIVMFLHGYCSHGSRITHDYIAHKMTENNIIYITLDFHGHGNSFGKRAMINNYKNLINDVLYVIDDINDIIDLKLPLFIMGHSMGGAVSIILYSHLRNKLNICGLILFCPALITIKLSNFSKYIIHNIITPLFPNTILPSFGLNDNEINRKIWSSKKYIKYIKNDELTWHLNPYIVSISNIIKLGDHALSEAVNIDCPIIIFHDKFDEIVNVQGSEEFIKNIKSTRKNIIYVNDGLHDIIANKLEYSTLKSIDWILTELIFKKLNP